MFTWSGQDFTTKLRSLRGVKKITVATAFFSDFGLNLLSDIIQNNNVAPANVTVYLSMEFSDRNPADLLMSLKNIAKPFIITKTNLHAKAFLFEGENDLFLSGSSNLTQGGFRDNLEFNLSG